MKPRRTSLITFLLVALGLMLSLARPAAAQVTPGPLLASQFFNVIAGTSTTYAINPDAVLHTQQGDYQGQAGIADFRSDLASSFSNIEFWAGDAIQAGNLVMVPFTMTALHTGTWHGLAANCVGIAADGVAMLKTEQQTVSYAPVQLERVYEPWETFEQTVVVEQWISFDEADLAGQIGGFSQFGPESQRDCGSGQDSVSQGDSELPPISPAPASREQPY